MKVWSVGNGTSNNDLIGACIPRIACDFERLVSGQFFLQRVGVEQLQLLLQSPWICDQNEVTKFKALCVWLNSSSLNFERTKREKDFDRLLELINAKKLPRDVVIETWVELPPMPTPRYATGAAHIPGVGDLVVGGWTDTGDDIPAVDNAEIFLTNSSPLGHAGSWCEIAHMLHSRAYPKAEFFNGNVYVAGDCEDSTSSVEMLSLFSEGPPQWTEVINASFSTDSMISFKGSLLFAKSRCLKGICHFVATNASIVNSKEVWIIAARKLQFIIGPRGKTDDFLIEVNMVYTKTKRSRGYGQMQRGSYEVRHSNSIEEVKVQTPH
ncbi:unnamed protein product [Rodentolepis nana]|uniref:BACK domain-containing protein n=1 Tax=Rodentolepis nana TaxID=102285 RepID=A0A0R3TVP1_RODNA|nr:unnamed protein product [Rodentolepis nana]